jgi:hypothetical protein
MKSISTSDYTATKTTSTITIKTKVNTIVIQFIDNWFYIKTK